MNSSHHVVILTRSVCDPTSPTVSFLPWRFSVRCISFSVFFIIALLLDLVVRTCRSYQLGRPRASARSSLTVGRRFRLLDLASVHLKAERIRLLMMRSRMRHALGLLPPLPCMLERIRLLGRSMDA